MTEGSFSCLQCAELPILMVIFTVKFHTNLPLFVYYHDNKEL